MKMSLITISLIFSTLVNSQDNSIYLKKGETTPYEGIFLTLESAKKVRQDLIEKDGLVKINASYESSLKLSDLNTELYKKQVDLLLNQNKTLMDERSLTDFQKAFWTSLGVVGTSAAVYLAAGLARK